MLTCYTATIETICVGARVSKSIRQVYFDYYDLSRPSRNPGHASRRVRGPLLPRLPTVAGPVDDPERRTGLRQQRIHLRPREPSAVPEGLHSDAGHSARRQLHDTRGASITRSELPEKGMPRAAPKVRGESRLQPLQQDVREPVQGTLRESK